MASYQDLESRLITVEKKIDFVMKSIRLSQPSPLVGMPPTLISMLDLYTESLRAGLEIIDVPKEDLIENGTDNSAQ